MYCGECWSKASYNLLQPHMHYLEKVAGKASSHSRLALRAAHDLACGVDTEMPLSACNMLELNSSVEMKVQKNHQTQKFGVINFNSS